MSDKRITDLPEAYRPAIKALPGDMQMLAAGMEERFPGMGVLIIMALAEIVNGQWVYVRRMDGPMRSWRDDQIRAQYDLGGITIRELARYWGLSQSSIEKILAKPASQAELKSKQMELFKT